MIDQYIQPSIDRIRAGIGSRDRTAQQAAISGMRDLIDAAARGSQAARQAAEQYAGYYGRMPSGRLVFYPQGQGA